MAPDLSPHITPLSDNLNQKAPSHLPDDNVEILPIARLHTIDIGRLHEGDTKEAAKLFKAAKEDGVFYLHFRDRHFVEMIDTVDDLFALSNELFSLSEDEKMEYDVDEVGCLKLNG